MLRTRGTLSRVGLSILALVMILAGCDSSPTSVTYTDFSPALTPNPATAVASTNAGFDWSVDLTPSVTETNGTAALIQTIQAVVFETSNGVVVEGGGEVQQQLTFDAQTAEVPARGTTNVGLTIDYTLPGGGKEARVRVAVSILGDNGALVTRTVETNVQ